MQQDEIQRLSDELESELEYSRWKEKRASK